MNARDIDDMEDIIDPLLMRKTSGKYIAQMLVRSGYRKPRTITTAEELDALPRLSVIRSDEGAVFERHTMWHEAGSRDLMYTSGIALPATVIWEPEPRP